MGIASIETPSGDSSDIDRLIRSLKDEPNSGLVFLPDAITGARRVRSHRCTVVQRKTGRPVQFEITEQTRAAGKQGLASLTPEKLAAFRRPTSECEVLLPLSIA